ncbi:MAG: adenylate/guanylate cyclase domain-containing protein [Planctomycetales bacterium]|nr:adenylate/guanylate cyclase domain-containing protein [Planctomycetales bacterium]
MADLVAQGAEIGDRWRRSLAEGRTIVIGRAAGSFAADWDDQISRQHVEVCFQNGTLVVRKLADARNPVFFRGRKSDEFQIVPGEHFVIGGTTFTLFDQPVNFTIQSPVPVQQQTFSPQYLQQIQYRNAQARIDVLGRLPDLISGATSEEELFVRLTNLLMAGIPTADAVAIVRLQGADTNASPIEVLHWDGRKLGQDQFSPSERLIREALERSESVLNLWNRTDGESRFTARDNVDWAFCTPVAGAACRGWAIYVAGRAGQGLGSSPVTDPTDFRDDLKFTEVAAATLKSLQQLRLLQKRDAGLSQFFSPLVLAAVGGEDPDVVLVPRETEVSVLFCDLRGFTRETEKSADDLLGLLDRVSKALGVTTHRILEQGGVVGDFQGDAVMGFWGWPIDQPDAIERAARAALAIRAEMQSASDREGDPLAGFRLGIGIATGKAVAGKIGTADQVKVTVFGPVANLASRLEGMTGKLRAPILLDETTARYVRANIAREQARCRTLAVIQPFGMQQAVEVAELLPPATDDATLSDDDVAQYEEAFAAFQAGRWDEAFERLHRVPAEDRAKDFMTVLIAQHNRTAPRDWDGIIRMDSK